MFSVQSLADASKFARVVNVWLSDFDTGGRQRQSDVPELSSSSLDSMSSPCLQAGTGNILPPTLKSAFL